MPAGDHIGSPLRSDKKIRMHPAIRLLFYALVTEALHQTVIPQRLEFFRLPS